MIQAENDWLASEEYKYLKTKIVANIKQEGMLKLFDTSDFWYAPASSKYHGNYPGGLMQHCWDVYATLDLPNHQEKAFLLAFCHDLCKINYYVASEVESWKAYTEAERETYKIEHGTYPKTKGCTAKRLTYTTKDDFPIGHGEKSVIVALLAGIELTNEEIVSIRWHMAEDDSYYQFKSMKNKIFANHYHIVKDLQRADQDATHEEDSK